MTRQPIPFHASILLPTNPNKDDSSRLGFFIAWLHANHLPWYRPALPDYLDYLQHHRTRPDPRTGEPVPATLSSATIAAHLATIRARYYALLHDNAIRDTLYATLPDELSPADRKAMVDELLIRLENDIHPRHTPLTLLTIQDSADADHVRLTPAQVRALVRSPGLSTLTGQRDTAILALLVCTGIREAELCALNILDLRQMLGGKMALRVRLGKGSKQRLVPYGALDWCLLYVERWLSAAHLTAGSVFRGIYKGEKKVRPTGITERAINQIMNRYPITLNGTLTLVQPHDLRRTYARNAYLHGMDMERIRQNLGHESVATTQTYIGTLDVSKRLPPDMFHPPHSAIELG